MNSKSQTLKKIMGIVQEVYSVIIIAVCIYFLLPIANINFWDAETIFVFVNGIVIIVTNILLFILGESVSKKSNKTKDYNQKQDIGKLVAIIALDCVCILCYLAFCIALSWGIGSWILSLTYGLLSIPLIVSIVLAGILLRITINNKKDNNSYENQK